MFHDRANIKQTSNKNQANVLKIHVHDVCSKFASCLLHQSCKHPLLIRGCRPITRFPGLYIVHGVY